MDEVERLIRTIFITHGRTRKISIEEREISCYDYEEDYIIQKLLYRHELREYIMKEGYTREQAEKIISESVVREILDGAGIDLRPKTQEKDQYVMANEEHFVEDELEHLRYTVCEEIMETEVKDYVLESKFHRNDKDEEKLREIYAEHNKKELTREQLVKELMKKGYNPEEAEQLLNRYTTIETKEEDKKSWDEADKLFKRPEYKPLKHYENKRIVKRKNDDIIVTDIPDCYEIMQIEEWELHEYAELNRLRSNRRYIYGTKKVPFRIIRKILREAEKQGRKTLIYSQLKQRIIEECKATEEEAKTAIYGAEITFKIRAMDPTLRKIWNLEPIEEVEYYWTGTTSGYPPFTLQDNVFNPIKQTLTEAEKEGKEGLTREELVEKAFEPYQKYKYSYRSVPIRAVTREFIEERIEDAEEILLITAITTTQNGEKTKYKLNKQIQNTTTNEAEKTNTNKQKKKKTK